MHTFASMRSTHFMEIDDKGGEIVQRYESLEIEIVQGGERQRSRGSRGWTWTWTKREATLKKRDGSKFFGQEKHTSRGSKLMNFD